MNELERLHLERKLKEWSEVPLGEGQTLRVDLLPKELTQLHDLLRTYNKKLTG